MEDDERQIRELVITWMTATQKGDTKAVLDLIDEEAVFLGPGRPPMIGKAAFASAAEAMSGANAPQIEGESEIQEINVNGDWAYMWTRLKVTVKHPKGAAPTVRAGTTLSVLRKQDGKWRLIRDANMLTPEP